VNKTILSKKQMLPLQAHVTQAKKHYCLYAGVACNHPC